MTTFDDDVNVYEKPYLTFFAAALAVSEILSFEIFHLEKVGHGNGL